MTRIRLARRRHRVAVLAYEAMSSFELGIVIEVFGLPRPELDVDWYELTVCTESTAPVSVIGGASLSSAAGLEAFDQADTVIVPGVADVHAPPSPALIGALRAAHERGARIASICSGAFALAAAGLLDGRRATTHWRYAEELQRRFPAINVDPDVLYLDDGDVLTSAGSAAGIDLCVHLVRRDFGQLVANSVARRLVVPPHRDGGQAQFIQSPVAEPDDDRISATMDWARRHLNQPITVERLARRAHLSSRSYLRRFRQSTGTSPIRWLIGERLQASLPLLEKAELSIEEVAAAVGFDAAVTYRHHFARAMRTTPSAYRRAFRGSQQAGAHYQGHAGR